MKKEIEKNNELRLEIKNAVFNVKLMYIGFFIMLLSFFVIFQTNLGWGIFAIGTIIMFYGAIKVEFMKKRNSIKTYKEIVNFFESNK